MQVCAEDKTAFCNCPFVLECRVAENLRDTCMNFIAVHCSHAGEDWTGRLCRAGFLNGDFLIRQELGANRKQTKSCILLGHRSFECIIKDGLAHHLVSSADADNRLS